MGKIGAEDRKEETVRRIIDNDLLTLIARLIVGIIFIYASFYKIIDPASFAKSIWYYHLVPGNLINFIALVMPWVELICGVCLIIGLFYDGSVVLINIMTVLFILVLSSAVYRGLDIDCGCFKASASAGGSAMKSLLFDIGLLVFTIFLLVNRSRRWRISSA